jgi:hypothetical protein
MAPANQRSWLVGRSCRTGQRCEPLNWNNGTVVIWNKDFTSLRIANSFHVQIYYAWSTDSERSRPVRIGFVQKLYNSTFTNLWGNRSQEWKYALLHNINGFRTQSLVFCSFTEHTSMPTVAKSPYKYHNAARQEVAGIAQWYSAG